MATTATGRCCRVGLAEREHMVLIPDLRVPSPRAAYHQMACDACLVSARCIAADAPGPSIAIDPE